MWRDLYIVRWLLQNTDRAQGAINWDRRESGMYFTNLNDGEDRVHIEVGLVQAMSAQRVAIVFASHGLGEIQLQEPLRNIITIGSKYPCEEDAELAETMLRLFAVISNQHAERKLKEYKDEDERRQGIFSRIIGGGKID